jgi:hypothetical protein
MNRRLLENCNAINLYRVFSDLHCPKLPVSNSIVYRSYCYFFPSQSYEDWARADSEGIYAQETSNGYISTLYEVDQTFTCA